MIGGVRPAASGHLRAGAPVSFVKHAVLVIADK